MEFHPEKREEILAKRKTCRPTKSQSRLLQVPISDDSPLVQRLENYALFKGKVI